MKEVPQHTQLPPIKVERKSPRNLSMHIPLETKEALKSLAAESGLTLAEYIETVLGEAVKNGDRFKAVLEKVPGGSPAAREGAKLAGAHTLE